jgi:hypothetical protein
LEQRSFLSEPPQQTGKDPDMRQPLSGLLYPAVFALFLSTGLPAQASLVQWSYDWNRSPAVVLAGTGGVTLTNEPGASAAGPSDVVATNLKVFSSANPASPDHLSPTPYTLSLALTDTASHASSVLTFTGTLSGTFSSGSAHVMNAFTGTTTQSVVLGGNTYTVTMGSYSPPGPPSATNSGSISAHVDVMPGKGGGPNKTPEPSTMVLACLGVSVIGLSSWKRMRRRPDALRLA